MVSRRGKPLVLLVYLARHMPRAVLRTELAALLWGERTEAKARQSLRQALLELKRVLGDALEVGQETVRLDPKSVQLDVASFERRVDEGDNAGALAQWAGEFLAGADDRAEHALTVWIDGERAGLRRRLAILYERMLADAESRGAWHDAAELARRWSEGAPFDERAAARLIAALKMDGHAVEAMAVHATFAARVREELDLEPSSSFLALGESFDGSVAPEGPAPPGAEDVFVGRDAEFAALSAAWHAAKRGRTTIALVEGDAGTGVSRLCDEVARWVRNATSSAVVLTADARDALVVSPGEGVAPYATARALFASLRDVPALGGIAPAALGALAALLPGVRERFPRVALSADVTPTLIADAMREAITAIAEDGPLLFIVTSVAGVDAESRAILTALTRMKDAPLLFVVADRSGAIDADHELASLRDDPSVTRVRLGPFTREIVATLIGNPASMVAADRDRLAERVHADTAGVPLFVTSLIDALAAADLISRDERGSRIVSPALEGRALPTPARVRSALVIASRELSDDGRVVLDALAVFGAPTTASVVARLTKLSPERAVAAIDSLTLARLASPIAGLAGHIALAPAILARAAYESIPTSRREVLHAGAAEELAAEPWRPWSRSAGDRTRSIYHTQRSATRAPRRQRSRLRLVSAAVLLVLAVSAIAAAAALRKGRAPVRARALAVFPFSVQGGAELEFLRAGMVELLSTSLDGVAGLRTLEPRTVIAANGAVTRDVPRTPESARRVAEQLGAASFVLGEAIGIQGRLQLSAALYDVRDATTPIARVRAEGRQDDLFVVVDRLTAQLAVAQGARASDRFMQLAAVTTTSIDALKSYLEGRAAYRDDDMIAALPAFERAVAADSTFSLAWYGLASTASWMLRAATERHAAAQAVRTSGRLAARDRTLVEAFDAYSRGKADVAEEKASSVANTYDDLEAWVILGETLFHHNWKRGRSMVESRKAWERVLASEPHYWPALQHLSEVAAVEGKREEADSLLRSYEASVGAEHMSPPSRAFQRFAFGAARDRDDIVARMSADRGFWLATSVWYVSVYGRDLDGARRLTLPLVDPIRPGEQQEFGRLLLAHLALAAGKWREAKAELAIARAHSARAAAEQYALMSLAPFLNVPATELSERREDLRRFDDAVPELRSAMPWPNPNAVIHPIIRAYLIGMLSARMGDAAAGDAAAAGVLKLPDPTGEVALARGYSHAIRAERAQEMGLSEKRLVELDSAARETPFVAAWTSPFLSQAYERFTRAEILHTLGRDTEALRWYETFGENSPYDLVYLAPALYRQAQIEERLGNRARAAARYTSFLALWKDCDPELRPLTLDAARHLVLVSPTSPANGKP